MRRKALDAAKRDHACSSFLFPCLPLSFWKDGSRGAKWEQRPAAASCLPPPSSIPFVCPCRVKCLEGGEKYALQLGGISSGHSPSQAEESSVAHRRMPAKCRDGVFLQRRPRHDGQRLCQESACIFLGKPSRYAKLLGAASKVAALSTTSTSIESHRVKLKSRRQKHQTNGSVVSRASNRAVREIKRTALTSLTADPPPPPRGKRGRRR